MGSVYNRGTRSRPNWYASFKELDGTRKTVPTKQPSKAQALAWLAEVEARIGRGSIGIPEPSSSPLVRDLMESWSEALTNRDAKSDRSRVKKHLLPKFGAMRLDAITLAVVMAWLDEQKASGELSGGSVRHNLNTLSRFYGWCIERGHTEHNPVKMIPTGKRPQQAPKQDQPWLDDDNVVRQLVKMIESPINLMFYVANQTGMRTGEVAGLRLSDLAFLSEDVIRVRYSYNGPLKEDKRCEGKCKWVPAPADIDSVIGPWIVDRKAAGAGPEDLVFPSVKKGGCMRAKYIADRFTTAANALGITMTWYSATRHSFVSRALTNGASLDEVSAAVGHANVTTTRRHYDHLIRRGYSAGLRKGLGLTSAPTNTGADGK